MSAHFRSEKKVFLCIKHKESLKAASNFWCANDMRRTFFSFAHAYARIYKEGLTERAIILCKLNKSLLEKSMSVGIHRQKSLYYLMNFCI